MSEKLTDEILEFTKRKPQTAVAHAIPGLGFSVYGEGSELPVWASFEVDEAIPGYSVQDGAVLTTQTESVYWVLAWDGARSFTPTKGPLTDVELRELIQAA